MTLCSAIVRLGNLLVNKQWNASLSRYLAFSFQRKKYSLESSLKIISERARAERVSYWAFLMSLSWHIFMNTYLYYIIYTYIDFPIASVAKFLMRLGCQGKQTEDSSRQWLFKIWKLSLWKAIIVSGNSFLSLSPANIRIHILWPYQYYKSQGTPR